MSQPKTNAYGLPNLISDQRPIRQPQSLPHQPLPSHLPLLATKQQNQPNQHLQHRNHETQQNQLQSHLPQMPKRTPQQTVPKLCPFLQPLQKQPNPTCHSRVGRNPHPITTSSCVLPTIFNIIIVIVRTMSP